MYQQLAANGHISPSLLPTPLAAPTSTWSPQSSPKLVPLPWSPLVTSSHRTPSSTPAAASGRAATPPAGRRHGPQLLPSASLRSSQLWTHVAPGVRLLSPGSSLPPSSPLSVCLCLFPLLLYSFALSPALSDLIMTCLAGVFVAFLVLGFVELLGSVGLWLLLYLEKCGHYFFEDVSVCLSVFSPLGTSITHILT